MITGAPHYIVLSLSTIIIALLGLAVWWKTRQLAFLAGFTFLYYWSLYGAWAVLARGTGSGGQYKFEYIFYKLFPVYLDEYYFWTIVLYALFIVVVQITVLAIARRRRRLSTDPEAESDPVCIDHRITLAAGATFGLGALYTVKDVLSAASTMGVSAYSVIGAIQSGSNPLFAMPLFSLYQVLNECTLLTLTLGLVVLICGPGARYMVGRQHGWPLPLYLILLAGAFAMNLMVGNRSTLVYAILPSALFYMANARRPRHTLIVAGALLGATAIVLPGTLRSAAALREMSGQSLADKVVYIVGESLSQQTESFATHASMYGALAKGVPFTYGSSLVWLASSVVPRVLRPELVPLVYEHYALSVGASRDQGFTINHATGWYLNFGIPGIFIGAFVFGALWAHLFNRFGRPSPSASHFGRVFSILAVWTFTGSIPTFIRGGPESYKGMLVEGLLIPTIVFAVAGMRIVLRGNRPRLVPAAETALP